MIRIINTILLSLVILVTQGQIIEDANVTQRQLIGNFDKIDISGNIRLIISQSPDMGLAVSANEEKYKDDIVTTIKNDVLFISVNDNKFWNSRSKGYTVYLSVKELNKIDASGAADIMVAGSLKSNSILFNLAGASSFKGSLLAGNVTMELRGASQAKLYGTAIDFQITCNGASDVSCYEFITQNCKANASGASDLQINVQNNLDATAYGASHIFYKGNASVAGLAAHGVSKIEKKN